MQKNCILLHGAWHGKWVFDKIISALSHDTNISVVALDLPGHYLPDHYSNLDHQQANDYSQINLSGYVHFVSDFIQKNNLYNSYLVGHSMAGLVISQVAQNIPQYIKKLIYLSAFIPAKQSSLIELEQNAKFPSVALHVTINRAKCAIELDKNILPELFYQLCSPADVALALSKIQAQPLLPFTDRVSLGSNFDQLYKVYIECLQDRAIHIEDQRRMSNVCNKIISLDADHSPFFSCPEALIQILQNELSD